MLGFLKKKRQEQVQGDFGDLDMPPAPPPIFEKRDVPVPFAPPPVERGELDSMPRPEATKEAMDFPLPGGEAGPEKPFLPDFMEEKPLDIHIPEPERAAAPPEAPLPPPKEVFSEEETVPQIPVPRAVQPPRPAIRLMAPPKPRVEEVFAPSPTVHQGQSIFINVDEYKAIVDSITGMKLTVKDAEDTLFKVSELNAKEEAEMLRFKRVTEDVERKFLMVDSKLFG